jgi:thiol-disulfide isomerase/thioredoxin
MTGRSRLAIGVGILLALQAAAWLLFEGREASRRAAIAPAAFLYEPMSGVAPMLDAALERANGTIVRLSDHHSRPIIVHFWATWCVPCRTELPALRALARDSGRASPQPLFLFVSLDESWATIDHFFEGKIPGEVVRDRTAALTQAFAVTTIPDTFVLGTGATLRARMHGARDWSSALARERLTTLIEWEPER